MTTAAAGRGGAGVGEELGPLSVVVKASLEQDI